MRHRGRVPVLLAIVLVLLPIASGERMEAGERAPAILLPGLHGPEFRYEPGRGGVPIVVAFVRPGQETSHVLLKELAGVLDAEAALAGKVRAVAIASGKVEDAAQADLRRRVPAEGPVAGALDPEYAAYKTFGVIALPTTFIVDGEGTVAEVLPGHAASWRPRLVEALGKALGIETASSAAKKPEDPVARRVERLLQGADRLAREGRPEDAVVMLEEAEKLRPDDADVLLALGGLQLHLERAQAADVAFQRAGAARPGDRAAETGRAKARALFDEDLDAAEEALRRALRKPPVDEDLYYYLGRLLERRGKTAEAAGAYRQAYERLREEQQRRHR